MKGLLIVLFLSLGTVLPLFHSGFFPMHDDTQVVRVNQMYKALSDGQFPVRWVSDLGYGFGYPIFNFYAPLPYYAGGFINFFTDSLSATKLMFFIGIILSGIFMYLLGKEISGEAGGVVASTIYLYAPYHALDIYVRGAVGEFWAMAFIPLFVWSICRLYKNKNKNATQRNIIFSSLSLSFVILSHNILGLITTGIFVLCLIIFSVILIIKKKTFKSLIYPFVVLILALLLSAFFWMPAFGEKDFTKVYSLISGGSDFRKHFVYPDQLWEWPWGYGGSAGRESGMSFKLGKTNVVFISISLIIFLLSKKRKLLFILFFFFLLLSLYMTLNVSISVWEALPLLSFVQYPWRFLAFTIFAMSGMIAFIISESHGKYTYLISAFIVVLTVVYNFKYFKPQNYNSMKNSDYLSFENVRWTVSKLSDEYMSLSFPSPKSINNVPKVNLVSTNNLSVKENIAKSHYYSYDLSIQEESNVIFNTAFFPGWKVYLDGQRRDIYDVNGKISVNIPSGKHMVELVFGNTPVRTVGNLISLSALILSFYIIFFKKKFV